MREAVINSGAILAFVNQPGGPVAVVMEDVASIIFAEDARENLNVNRPHRGRDGSGRNPPPNPPFRRTGDLVRSINVEPAKVDSGELTVYVSSDPGSSSHYHYQPDYARWLLDEQYEFLTPAARDFLTY